MQNLNEIPNNESGALGSDNRHILVRCRILILGLWLLPLVCVAGGLTVDSLAARFGWVMYLVVLALSVIAYIVYARCERSLFRLNCKLKQASRWNPFRPWLPRRVDVDLNEREKVIVDQGFRSAYMGLALACYLLTFFIYIGHWHVNLPATGDIASLLLVVGVGFCLTILPETIIAWRVRE